MTFGVLTEFCKAGTSISDCSQKIVPAYLLQPTHTHLLVWALGVPVGLYVAAADRYLQTSILRHGLVKLFSIFGILVIATRKLNIAGLMVSLLLCRFLLGTISVSVSKFSFFSKIDKIVKKSPKKHLVVRSLFACLD